MTKAVIYLEKTSLDYYAEKMQAIPKLIFPAAVMQDIEIIDIPKLDQTVKAFIDTNKLLPTTATIILANSTIFTKDILKPDKKIEIAKPSAKNAPQPAATQVKSEEEETQNFLETVPFDEVSSISLPIQNGTKIVAANKQLFTYLKRSFEKCGFTIEAVTPLAAMGNAILPIDPTVARRLLEKIDLAKQHNMLVSHVVSPSKIYDSPKKGEAKPSNKRLYAMVGFLIILFVILGILIYTTMLAPTPPKKTKPVVINTPAPTITVSLAPTITEEVSSNSAVLNTLSVQIIESTFGSSEAANLKKDLATVGLKDTTIKTSKVTAKKTVVTYAKTLPKEVKQVVTSVFAEELPTASLIESSDLVADIVITLGNTK